MKIIELLKKELQSKTQCEHLMCIDSANKFPMDRGWILLFFYKLFIFYFLIHLMKMIQKGQKRQNMGKLILKKSKR